MTARTLAWTGFLAIAAFALMVASRLTALDPVENVSLSVTAPVQNALHDSTQPVADWVNNFTDASGLSSENKHLRADNERLTNELARAREDSVQARNAQDLDAIRAQFPNDAFLAANNTGSSPDAKYAQLLHDWYVQVVKPALDRGGHAVIPILAM